MLDAAGAIKVNLRETCILLSIELSHGMTLTPWATRRARRSLGSACRRSSRRRRGAPSAGGSARGEQRGDARGGGGEGACVDAPPRWLAGNKFSCILYEQC